MHQAVVWGELPSEQDVLAGLDRKLKLVNDRVAAVVRGFSTGFYLCGAAGLGKSFGVLRHLRELEADFRVFNSRMTGKGLFQTLEKHPDAVHVLEDMERITNDRDAQGVLRSALWSQSDREREVTWTNADGEKRFAFRGGIVMLANRPLSDLPELRALATRISVLKLQIADAEMVAHMRRIARQGWGRYHHKLEPAQSTAICEHVIAECRKANCPLDLRLLDNACCDFLQWESGNSSCHWHDLVANRVRQAAIHFNCEVSTMTTEERMEHERKIVLDICKRTEDAQERVRLWNEMTGKSLTVFYRRKKQAESTEFAA